MNLNSKQFKSVVPGTPNATYVIDDISVGIRSWKKTLKETDSINKLTENRYYIKPSDKKRKQKELAKYKERMK